jgi:hypothetical protein
MFSRRGFLIGAGSLLTTAFVKEASTFVRTTGVPLLVAPPESKYWLFWHDYYRAFALGPTYEYQPPARPSWREFLVDLCILDMPTELPHLMRRYGVTPARLDDPVDNWDQWSWHIFDNNFAAAYRMLKRLDLGPSLGARYGGPCLEFHNRGYIDSSPCCAVTVTHPLALSLLQARVIDLKLPIGVRLMSSRHRQVDEYVRAAITEKDAGLWHRGVRW